MDASISSSIPVLNSLIRICNDGNTGYEQAAEKMDMPEFKALLLELASQREQFGAELAAIVVELGGNPKTTGTFKGAMHRAWIKLKAATLIETPLNILADCKRGEDAAVGEYGFALDHDELPARIFNVIRQQYISVKAAHARVSNLLERLNN